MKAAFGKILRSVIAAALWLHHRLVPWDSPSSLIPYVWLIWIPFFFVPWNGVATGAMEYAATAVALVLFLALYFRSFWARGERERLVIVVLVAMLGWALIPFNLSGGGLLIYAGAIAGFCLSPRLALAVVVIAAAAVAGEYIGLGIPLGAWLWAPIITVGVGLGNLWMGQQVRQHLALKASQSEIKRLAAVAERERIARDLHDLLGHTLTLITVKAELAATLAERDLPGAAREIHEVEAISRDALRQVREAVGGYRSGGLTDELSNARAALAAAEVNLDEKIGILKLSPEQDSALAMALREAVTNIVRHSGAHHCRIELENSERELKLLIEDDGHGGTLCEGNGLTGMRERLRAVSANLDIASDLRGTRLAVCLPMPNPAVPGTAAAAR